RAPLHHLADELDAEPAAPVLRQNVDVGQVDTGDAVGEGAGEADLPPVRVEADDAARFPDRLLDRLPRPALRPVRVVREELVDGVDVDPMRVVVEFDSVSQLAPHGAILEPDHPLPLVAARAVAVLRLARAALPLRPPDPLQVVDLDHDEDRDRDEELRLAHLEKIALRAAAFKGQPAYSGARRGLSLDSRRRPYRQGPCR